ncbi:MAG TPA: 2OG-Fe(II) oxygenase [Parvularculaceae bacterium]|nr:2OG-Fe(II) oxygenase [Amphiplicatus sp.]MCB9955816.1 2OG-Fe(II) oxygenase [Caulobacterales bacterium]HPE32762.1 2OG-Fe(II) oxygenase [Parvularculaceae bacterium]HRX38407.1 2OG-Fe(II) oxygenase [Parvularculaceae bacterium]
MINFNALEAAKVYDAPFRFITAEGALTKAQAGEVRRDYPTIDRSGYLPLTKLDVKGAFASLIDDLQSKRLAEILSDKLSLDLVDKPRMITVRKLSKIGDGRVHNDSVSKITTMLIYLNDDWDPAEGGAIRALNGPDDMDDFSLEFPPLAGNVFAFARSDTSWHGHPPFAGERYVVQTTFLVSQDALDRKENRGALQMLLKKLNPFAS